MLLYSSSHNTHIRALPIIGKYSVSTQSYPGSIDDHTAWKLLNQIHTTSMNSSNNEGKRKFTKTSQTCSSGWPFSITRRSWSNTGLVAGELVLKVALQSFTSCSAARAISIIAMTQLYRKSFSSFSNCIYQPCKTKQSTGVSDALAVLNVVVG